jgi:hypothetical protein
MSNYRTKKEIEYLQYVIGELRKDNCTKSADLLEKDLQKMILIQLEEKGGLLVE